MTDLKERELKVLADEINGQFFKSHRYYISDVLVTKEMQEGVAKRLAEFLTLRYKGDQKDASKAIKKLDLKMFFEQPSTQAEKHSTAIYTAQRDLVFSQFNFFLSERAESLGFPRNTQLPMGRQLSGR